MDGYNSNDIEEVAINIRAKSYGKKHLYSHIAETINRIIQFEEFLEKNRFLSFASDNSNFIFDHNFFENLAIACFLHDLGKFNPTYHKYLYKKTKCDEDKKGVEKVIKFFENYENLELEDHEAVSVIFSFIFLKDNLGNSKWNEKIRTAILLHHYNDFYLNEIPHIAKLFDRYPDLEKYLEFLLSKKDKIKKILEEIIDLVKSELQNKEKYLKILDNLKENISFERLEELKKRLAKKHSLSSVGNLYFFPHKDDIEFYKFLVFLGLLRRCDYSASAEVEIEKSVSLSEDVFNNLENKIKNKLKKDDYFWQEEIIKKIKSDDKKDVILIAPTGSGKTEFALLWAKNIGKKLIYTVPLRAALNDIFLRILKEDKYFDVDNVGILHSTAFIEYIDLKELYRTDVESLENLSKLFSFPILLSTPDQVFLVCLKYYGCDKIISIYPISLLVIDEVQSYKPEMMAILIKSLQIAKSLGSNFLIITATYPPYFDDVLREQGIDVEKIKRIDIIKDLDNETKKKIKNCKLKRHRFEIINKQIFSGEGKLNEDALNEIKKIIKENNKSNILIIVNNVKKAIEIYKLLKNENVEIGSNSIYLLHSRLIEKEKKKRIENIKKKINNREKGIILVATQIVEASVDIDFDILITEISPIDSQIQRWGRIYRNRTDEGDYKEEKPNIYIFIGEDGKKIDKGTLEIYDEELIKKTVKILKEKLRKEEVYDYETERLLIDEVFDYSLKKYYKDKITKTLRELDYISVEKKSEAQKIFRRIAGLQVVIYELMKEEEDEKTREDKVESKLERIFGEVIDEKIKKIIKGEIKEDKISWNEIIEDIKKKIQNDKIKDEIEKMKDEELKYKLKEILYLYSVNLPYFLLIKIILEKGARIIPFKGFYILYDEEIKKHYNKIKIMECGIDEYFGKDLDLIIEE